MTEIADMTRDPGRSIRTGWKEDELEGFHVVVEVEGLVEDGQEEEARVEDEEVVVGFPRGGRGRGGRGGEFEHRGRPQERGENWRCGQCGFQNYPDRKECHKCHNAKSAVPQSSDTNAMDDTRNQIELMILQLQ